MTSLFTIKHQAKKANLQFSMEQLNRLFDYFILLDENATIINCSDTLKSKCPAITDVSLFTAFNVTKDNTAIHSLKDITSHTGMPVQLAYNNMIMQGHFEEIDNSAYHLLFTGKETQTGEAYTKDQHFDKIDDTIWEHDFRTGITNFSKKQSELLGASLTDDNVKLWWDSVHPEDKIFLEQNDEKYKNKIIDCHVSEYRIFCKDGSYKWILDKGNVIEKAADGSPLKIVGTHTDISTLKNREIKLRESEMRYRALSENLPGAVYECVITRAGVMSFSYISKSIERLFDIPVEKFTTSLDHLYPDDRPAFEAATYKTVYENKPFFFEGRIITGSGAIKWHSASAYFSTTKDNGDRLLTGIIMDITERKEAEFALRESEMRFKDLAQNVPGVVFQWKQFKTEPREFPYVSPKLKDYFDVDPSQIRMIAKLVHPEDKGKWEASLEKANNAEGSWEFEGRLLYPDNTIKWMHGFAIKSVTTPEHSLYNGILIDITAHKTAEIRVRAAEQLYQFALEGAGDGVWEYDLLDRTIFYSPRYKQMLGYEDDAYPNDPDQWLKQMHEDDFAKVVSIDEQYITGKIDRHHLEYRILCKEGNYIWVLDRGMVIERDSNGRAKKIIGTITDITSRKQLETELETTANRLSNLIFNLNDGIIVEDENRRIVLTNQKFCDMFDISFMPKVLIGSACKEIIRHCGKQIKDPVNFDELIHELVVVQKNVSSIILELANDKIYEMDCIPIFIDGKYKGHLWKYADVTDRVLADNKLEAQKKFYEDVLNGIPADIAVLNEHREYLYVNPYAVKSEEMRKWLIGKTDEDFCKLRNKPIEIAKHREALFDSVKASGRQIEWEEKNITQAGNPLHYLRKLYPVLNNDGKVKFMIGYGIDITERKRFEDQLSLSEKRYRDLFNYSQALICTHDLSGNILSINPATCKLLGYEEKEMLGKNIMDFIPEHDRSIFAAGYIAEFARKDNAKGVFCVITKTGNQKFLLYQNYKVHEPGKDPYIVGFSQDITERKKIEEVIRSGEEKYRSIIENMNLGMVELDPQSTILFANENLCKMSGYDMKELVGQKLYNVFSKGESRHFIKQKMYLKKEGVSEVYEFVATDKQGNQRWWLVSGSPLHTHTGEFKGSLLICLDITQQKILEQELRHAKKQAEESARAKDLFLANMSHEIRTPMNAILGMGKQLERTVMDGQQQLYLNAINGAASNLLVIINDILDFSKIEAGKMTLDNVGFELHAVANKALQVIVHKAEEKGLALTSTIDPTIAPVLIGDPHRINQVLINLLGNSVKFTEKGGINIYCRAVSDSKGKQVINIEIVDTGIGMSEDFQKSLFDKFLQEDDKNGKKYSGTGLGMSIVKELIELMQGDIRVQSKKNIGTIISINIPFQKGTKADLPKKEERKTSSNILFNKRILLVEDNEMNRMLATIVLNQYSAIVDEAFNGEEALAAMKTNEYDIILMDMRMPVMDGLEATTIIRRDISATIPIIALTANAVIGEKQKCLEAGMNDFLVKPFAEEELVQMLAKWLGIQDVFNKQNQKDSTEKKEALFSIDNLKSISRGNNEFITKMLNIFIKEINLALQEIRKGEETNNIELIKSTAHRIKPSLSNMSVNSLKEEVLALERFDFAGDRITQLPESINKVEEILTEVVVQIEQLIKSGEY